jgi:hypothetical protein
MRKSRTRGPSGRLTRVGLFMIATIVAGSAGYGADARKAVVAKTTVTQQQKPIKLRYYGGPKSPMYPG